MAGGQEQVDQWQRAPDGRGEPGGDGPLVAAYHLRVEQDEAPVLSNALRLLISDEAHEHAIRGYARAVLAGLDGAPDEHGVRVLSLAAPELKILHTSVKLLRDDLSREQADERRLLAGVLDKLPDEHAIRAIRLD